MKEMICIGEERRKKIFIFLKKMKLTVRVDIDLLEPLLQ